MDVICVFSFVFGGNYFIFMKNSTMRLNLSIRFVPVLFLHLLLVFQNASAQDATYSQFQGVPLYLNPSFAGSTGAGRVNLNYRNMWPSLSGNYVDYNLGYDQYFHALRGGVGVNLQQDIQGGGAFHMAKVDVSYAPHFQFFDNKIAVVPSIDLAYIQNSVDFSKLNFGNAIDPRRGFVYQSAMTPENATKNTGDLSAGLLAYSTRFSAGFSVFHLTQPDVGVMGNSPLPVKYTFHGSYTFGATDLLNNGVSITPSFVCQRQQSMNVFIPAVTLVYKHVSVGLAYRTDDAAIGMIGFRSKRILVGYSYDYTISTLRMNSTGGAHELSLSWLFGFKHRPENFIVFPSRFF
jgi:type IX secretion system PorP/SprF family membrane protein